MVWKTTGDHIEQVFISCCSCPASLLVTALTQFDNRSNWTLRGLIAGYKYLCCLVGISDHDHEYSNPNCMNISLSSNASTTNSQTITTTSSIVSPTSAFTSSDLPTALSYFLGFLSATIILVPIGVVSMLISRKMKLSNSNKEETR